MRIPATVHIQGRTLEYPEAISVRLSWIWESPIMYGSFNCSLWGLRQSGENVIWVIWFAEDMNCDNNGGIFYISIAR